MVAFLLSKTVPQDPVNSIMVMRGVDHNEGFDQTKIYDEIYRELNLHLPVFYFTITPSYYPDNLNSISSIYQKDFYKNHLKKKYNHKKIESFINKYEKEKTNNPSLGLIHDIEQLEDLDIQHQALRKEYNHVIQSKASFILPKMNWHGLNNQYHNWITSFFDGSFGFSIVDGKSALSKVKKALSWTLSITLLDFIISLPLGLLIGFLLARNPNGKKETLVTQILFLIYSIPLFWLATMLVVFLTTDDYGSWTNIFPSVGIDIFPGKGTGYHIINNLPKLFLPVFCLVIHSLAYSSRFVRRSMLNEMNKEYIVSAYSKGLNKNQVLKNHVLPNALIPVITILVAMIPAAFASSLVLEVIFNIPGIGRLLYNSIFSADWNVSFCILMIIAIVTTISYLIGDILYAMVNPKLRFN